MQLFLTRYWSRARGSTVRILTIPHSALSACLLPFLSLIELPNNQNVQSLLTVIKRQNTKLKKRHRIVKSYVVLGFQGGWEEFCKFWEFRKKRRHSKVKFDNEFLANAIGDGKEGRCETAVRPVEDKPVELKVLSKGLGWERGGF